MDHLDSAIEKMKFTDLKEFFRLSKFTTKKMFSVARIKRNLIYFEGNYFLLLILVYVFLCISRPAFFFCSLVSGFLVFRVCDFDTSMEEKIVFRFGGVPFDRVNLLVFIFVVVILLTSGSTSLIVAILLYLLFVILHSSMYYQNTSFIQKRKDKRVIGKKTTPMTKLIYLFEN